MTKKKECSLDIIYCLSPTISSSTAKMLESGRNWRFRQVVRSERSMLERSFELASSGSIVRDAIVEKRPLLDTVRCFGRPQSSSTATAKTAPFPSCFNVTRAKRGGRRDRLGLLPVCR